MNQKLQKRNKRNSGAEEHNSKNENFSRDF